MIGAEIAGSPDRSILLVYVRTARPRDTGAWREINPATPPAA
jgi:hypothetical protein